MEAVVSIVLSVYNGEAFLADALESLLVQSYDAFELIIVDDASSDHSPGIIREFAARDSRIQVIQNTANLGLTVSLNKGLKQAQGKWIVRQDADDLSRPDRIEKQVSFLEAHPDIVMVGACYESIDESGNKLTTRKIPLSDEEIRWEMLFQNPFIHSAVCFRRLNPEGNPYLYDESFSCSQDYRLW
ncbi:MAG: glycosyltransferase family 2 protein, partial [Verrucomicrobiota bacterium]